MIEPLESRIAPASMIPFTDIDGDRVIIRSTVGTLTAAMLDLSAPAGPAQLYSLTVTAPEFTGATITFTVSRVPGGDGLVNVGKLNAVGVDLVSVTVPGDLANIQAGNADTTTPGLRTLTVQSMGTLGLSTQRGSLSPTLNSFIMGDAHHIRVASDVRDAKLFVEDGGILTLTILGQLDGGQVVTDEDIATARIQDGIVGRSSNDSGSVLAHGSIGTMTLHGPITGGAGERSGSIHSDHDLRVLNLDGTLSGGFGTESGRVSARGLLSFIKMHGDVIGGTGEDSGVIHSIDSMRDVSIAGKVMGGAGDFSGRVASDIFGPFMPRTSHLLFGDLLGGAGIGSGTFVGSAARGEIRGFVIGGSGEGSGVVGGAYGDYKVTKDVIGGSGDQSGGVGGGSGVNRVMIGGDIVGGSGDNSGVVGWAAMNSLTVGGDVRGGSVSGTDSLHHSGVINAGDVGKIVILGSIISGSDSSSGTLEMSGAIDVRFAQTVEVRGDLAGNSTAPVTIRSNGSDAMLYGFRRIVVGGDVRHANLFGGADFNYSVPDTKIGLVQVNGDWTASNLVAGCDAGSDGLFGTADDYHDTGRPTRAAIERVVIRGTVTGTSDPGDHFGIVAEDILSVTIAGITIPLTPGEASDVDELTAPGTGDFTLREIHA